MNIETRPISEISRRATHLLFEKMGAVDTIRFLNQFSIGHGDYTKEREQWLGDISLDNAISQIKSQRENAHNQLNLSASSAAALREKVIGAPG